MAAKKKTKKKQMNVKPTKKKQVGAKAASRKAPVAKKPARSAKAKKPAKRQPLTKKRVVKKPAAKARKLPAKAATRKPVVAKKSVVKKRSGGSNPTMDVVESPLNLSRARTGGQSGDLQGLSNAEGSGSESVDELLEEGNSFEAGIVSGVESAGNADEEEVQTHEVLEDDVPDEYLDNER
jgi:hypothetical protein